jgi:hypothetical protein
MSAKLWKLKYAQLVITPCFKPSSISAQPALTNCSLSDSLLSRLLTHPKFQETHKSFNLPSNFGEYSRKMDSITFNLINTFDIVSRK